MVFLFECGSIAVKLIKSECKIMCWLSSELELSPTIDAVHVINMAKRNIKWWQVKWRQADFLCALVMVNVGTKRRYSQSQVKERDDLEHFHKWKCSSCGRNQHELSYGEVHAIWWLELRVKTRKGFDCFGGCHGLTKNTGRAPRNVFSSNEMRSMYALIHCCLKTVQLYITFT